MSKAKYRLGIIGMGTIAELRTLPAIKEVQDFDLVCAYDSSAERLEYISNKYSIPDVMSLEELFSKRLDAVYIATPNAYHVPLAIEALRNGAGVLLEKPCADTPEAAGLLLEAAGKYDRPLLIAYMHKWNHYNQKARQLVKDKAIGELCSISAYFGFLNRDLDKWRLLREISGPGALGDLGIYIISTAMDIFEEMPVSCNAKAYPAGSAEYGDKFLSGRVKFSNGRWLQFDTSFLSIKEASKYTIIGTEGAIHVEGTWFQSGDGKIALCKGNHIELISEEVVNPYEQELRCLKECLDGKPVPAFMSIETAYKDIKIMGALDRSAALMGKEVAII